MGNWSGKYRKGGRGRERLREGERECVSDCLFSYSLSVLSSDFQKSKDGKNSMTKEECRKELGTIPISSSPK